MELTKGYDRDERRIWRAVFVCVLALVLATLTLEIKYDFLPLMSIADPTGDLTTLLLAFIAVLTTWVVLHLLGGLFERLTTTKLGSHAQARSMWKFIAYVVWILVLSIIFISMIGETGSLVLSLGLFGAALTFVLQKPLLNVGAWALISYRRIYRIGDRVAFGTVKGYVLDITTMYTELREFGEWMHGDTFTGRIVTVPNSLIFDQPVCNYTRDFPFVWDEVVNLVTYESDIEVAKKYMLESTKEVVGELMEQNFERYRRRLGIRDLDQLLLRSPELRMELADSGVNMYVLYFCPVELRRKIKGDITEKIWTKFMSDPNVGIAYPHMHLVGSVGQG
ncbi:MAG: mechanosensitive ion channel family protein [Thermoplasmata archaeon]